MNKENTSDTLAQVSALGQLMKTLQEKGQGVPDEMYQMFLQMLPELSMRKNALHRKGVKGFSADALNAFSHQMMHQAHQISKLEARDDLVNLLEKAGVEAQEAAFDDRMLAGNVREELKNRHEWAMNPSNAQWTNWTSSFGFLMFLGASPAAALVNLSQVAVVGYPTLAGKFGWKASSDALLKAASLLNVKETLVGDDALSRAGMSAQEIEAFAHWHDTGVINKSQAQMLAGVGDSDSLQNSATYQKWMGRVAHLFHKAEVLNREVMLLAGYRLARGSGMSHEAALQYAQDATWESQFDYSNANRARFMQNDAAKLFLMFKSYSQHMIYFILRNARQWGKGGADAKQARAKLLGILGVTLAMGGVSALPIGIVGAVTGLTYAQAKYGTKKALAGGVGVGVALAALAAMMFDDEEDWETEMRKALRAMGGDTLETLVFRGAVNAVAGVDMSSRISLDDLLIRGGDQEMEAKDAKGALLEALGGPVVSYGVNALYTVPELWSEDHEWRAVEKLMPKFARDYMQATRYMSEGALTKSGATVVDADLLALPFADELNLWNILWKSQGFGAEKLTGQYQQNSDYMNYKKRVDRTKDKALTRYFMATMAKDADGVKEAMEGIKEWNARNPEAKQIDGKALKRSMAARLRGRKDTDAGKGVRVQEASRYLME